MNIPLNRTIVRLMMMIITGALLAISCSSSTEDGAADEGATDTETSETAVDTTDTTESDESSSSSESTDTSESTTTTDSDTDAGSTTNGDNELPGEAWDGFAAAGDAFAVMGVAHDDELNVRELPDASSSVVTSVGPTEVGLVATGRARLLPESIWYEVNVGAGTGWVNASFVGFMGGTDDATAEYLAAGSQGRAETMVDLARAVSAEFASTEPQSRIVQSVAPTVGDLGEITYDVIGLGDDSVAGLRLHIFATPDTNGETFTLKSIERTVFCSRGSDGELCI